jgi:hypothetical protein
LGPNGRSSDGSAGAIVIIVRSTTGGFTGGFGAAGAAGRAATGDAAGAGSAAGAGETASADASATGAAGAGSTCTGSGFRLLDERLRHRRQRWRNLVRLDQRLMPGERLEDVALHADGLQRLDEVVVRFRRRGAAPDHLGADAPLDDRRAGLADDDAFTADRDLRLLDEAELFGGALHLFVAQRALGALVAQPDLLESSGEILGLDVPFFCQFVHPARHRHVPHSPASG